MNYKTFQAVNYDRFMSWKAGPGLVGMAVSGTGLKTWPTSQDTENALLPSGQSALVVDTTFKLCEKRTDEHQYMEYNLFAAVDYDRFMSWKAGSGNIGVGVTELTSQSTDKDEEDVLLSSGQAAVVYKTMFKISAHSNDKYEYIKHSVFPPVDYDQLMSWKAGSGSIGVGVKELTSRSTDKDEKDILLPSGQLVVVSKTAFRLVRKM